MGQTQLEAPAPTPPPTPAPTLLQRIQLSFRF
jgi:hypothetical protein